MGKTTLLPKIRIIILYARLKIYPAASTNVIRNYAYQYDLIAVGFIYYNMYNKPEFLVLFLDAPFMLDALGVETDHRLSKVLADLC
jgi:hypothetical protein